MNRFQPGLQTQAVNKLLENKNNILIIGHSNPDGDAIGSSLALAAYLRLCGKNARVLMPDPFPDFLNWLPGASDIFIFIQQKKESIRIIKDSEIIFCLDFNSLNRLGPLEKQIAQSGLPMVLVDHHLEPDKNFDAQIHTIEVSSTSELVFELILHLPQKVEITKEIASCLYVGIMTDTGSFSYSCNNVRTYEITAHLVNTGLDVREIHNLIYDTFSENRLRLMGHLLLNRMKVLPEFATAYIYMSIKDQEKFGFTPGDSEGFVNYALSIKGIRFAAFFTEKKELIRISFRSKGDFSVNDFARKHYLGGGHRNAAGGNSLFKLRSELKHFENLLTEYKEELTNADKIVM
ncbi:MAG: bifunctional oligoribonuclease/PAP phosphatase NrnA [Bacteroidales bacterium]|nr:bifunctional oligoribonuclease/PAP phosphatase NrnA [Bacteroidales bacterium]